jgi:hypothetical protein
MKDSERQADDPLRLLLEMFALQVDVLARYLERIYDEAFLETAGSSGTLRPGTGYVITTHDDGTLTVEFGDAARGSRPPTDFDPIAVRYQKVSGQITVESRAHPAPPRPPAASGPSPRGGAAPGRRSPGSPRRPSPR